VLAAIPALYLLGRRAFGRRTALIGAALWTVLPYPIPRRSHRMRAHLPTGSWVVQAPRVFNVRPQDVPASVVASA